MGDFTFMQTRACFRSVWRPVVFAAAVFGLGLGTLPAFAQDAAKRNLVLLLSDDHSYPFVGTFGDANVQTPNLDALAARGFKGHRFFTSAPQCVPSRAALLTGRSPVAARMTRFTAPLPGDQLTLPDYLRDQAGYHTGVCGRGYHLDGPGTRANPVLERILTEHNLRTFKDRVDFLENGPDRAVPEIVGRFLDQRPTDKPFFLWANFSDPHHVWDAPASFRPDPATLVLPAHLPDLPGVRSQLADYCAEVNRLDATIGRVLEQLSERDLLDSTVIVFHGDNGAALPHGKGSLYDPGSHVPLIVAGPGIAAGIESHSLLSGEDITPTFLQAAAVAVPDQITGYGFWGLLTGGEYQLREHVFVERGPHGSAPVRTDISSSGYDLARAVRSDRYKLIYNATPWIPYSPVDSAGGAGWKQIQAAHADGSLASDLAATYFTTPRPVYELYDLEADPAELRNRAGDPELAAVEDELRAALIEKMVLDFDYLPLPTAYSDASAQAGNSQAGNSAAAAPSVDAAVNQRDGEQRERRFIQLDRDRDGKLSWEEFRGDRQPAEARRWFDRRDTNRDGFVDREEYLPATPLPRD